jgi:oxaloacetate decarboxylase alpha subunit
MATTRGKAMLDWEPPQPSLEEIRREYGTHLCDEELLLRYLIPGPDVDAMYAAGRRIEPVYPLGGPQGLGWIKELLDASDARAVTASLGPVTVALRR